MTAALDRMIRNYDRTMVSGDYQQYFEGSGFYNFGYWDAHTRTQREASEALVDRMVSRIARPGEGSILDVACGPGGTTRRLLRYYAPAQVTAINVSAAQIAEARRRAPGCAFHVMNATHLGFPDASFDALVCVEAAFHFDTRDRFLREAFRVLKPGGSLVLSDMLFRELYRPFSEYGQIPRANLLPTLGAFGDRLGAAGFEAVEVLDVTRPCLGGFRRHVARWGAGERRRGRMGIGKSIAATVIGWGMATYFGFVLRTYLIASAHKPA